jgi:Immunity protein 31
VSDIGFYEIVNVLSSADAVALGVGNARGVVVGISGEANERKYAVLIGERTFMLDPSDLVRTGESVDREAIYGGETMQVSPERYPDKES